MFRSTDRHMTLGQRESVKNYPPWSARPHCSACWIKFDCAGCTSSFRVWVGCCKFSVFLARWTRTYQGSSWVGLGSFLTNTTNFWNPDKNTWHFHELSCLSRVRFLNHFNFFTVKIDVSVPMQRNVTCFFFKRDFSYIFQNVSNRDLLSEGFVSFKRSFDP